MKEHIKKILIPIFVCALCLILAFPFFMSGCGTSITYSGSTLINGQVGAEYTAYVGTATGADEITYALKEGSILPAGLTIDADGFVVGIPEAKAEALSFTVVATADGASAEADFTITIGEGAIVYEDGALKVANSGTFTRSVATATGAENITYALADDGGTIPAGVTISEDGTLTGSISTMGTYTFFVTASATDCTPATAEFALEVAAPWLDYEVMALQTATVGSYYTGSVASARDGTDAGEELSITYEAVGDLPAGLEMTDDGLLYGMPEEAGTFDFEIRARRSGYTSAISVFSLKINSALNIEVSEGNITFVDEDTVLTAERNTDFLQIGAINARASNRQPITFEIAAGDLPSGVTFYPNGTLAGRATRAGDYPLTIRATAAGCETVEKEYTLTVLVTLIYEGESYLDDETRDLYVGQEVSLLLATAEFPAGTTSDSEIVYEVVSGLPAGLTLSSGGMLTGTPTRSYLSVSLVVRASADGFASKNATFTYHIEDAMVSGVTVFEAEYTDLRGIVGSGYSGSATGSGLIQNASAVIASRSRDGKTSEMVAGGSYIPFVFGPITLTFEIESNRAVNGATLSLSLDSEIGSMSLDPSILEVTVNGTPTSYSAQLTRENGAFTEFERVNVGTGNLIAGPNVITVSIVANTIYGGRTGGPAIDCLEIGNLGGATLSWRPALYNLPSLTQA